MLNAVLFDLDNTLVDRDQAFRECLNAHFPDAGVRTELFRLDHGGRGDSDALFDRWAQHAGTSMNQEMFGRLLAERLQPDVELLAALRALAAAVKLGIITNGGSATQRQKFRAAGLAAVIPETRVWVSAEVGLAKPDPAIFRLASQALGESPENCLYLGDDELDDLAGATAAGLRARLVEGALDAAQLDRLLREERAR